MLLAEHSSHVAYLEGVMGVRSFPMVWITLRPHTQSPVQMPTPPYSSSQIGVGDLDMTEPLSYRSHRAMSGPIALLVKKMGRVNPTNQPRVFERRETTARLPDVVTSMGKGAEAGGEYLQELEERRDSRWVDLQLILLRGQRFRHHRHRFLSHAPIRHCAPTGYG